MPARHYRLPGLRILRREFRYVRETGELFWLTDGRFHYAGQRAGHVGKHGYWVVTIAGKLFRQARIIWKMVTGKDPGAREVDHKNRKRIDNRWRNLRLLSRSGQVINTGPNPRNTSGVKGVWRRRSGRFCAQITVDQKTIVLGTFNTLRQAARVRRRAELQLHAPRTTSTRKRPSAQ